jgi:hypothetical protein
VTYCEYLTIEANGLTHWAGLACPGSTWYQLCTGSTLTRAVIRPVPTLPLCSVCLTVSEILTGGGPMSEGPRRDAGHRE